MLSKILFLAGALVGMAALAEEAPPEGSPNTIVVKVQVDAQGGERLHSVTPVYLNAPAVDEESALEGARALELEQNRQRATCNDRIKAFMTDYRRVVRRVVPGEVAAFKAAIVAGCELPCDEKIASAVKEYRRVVRHPQPRDEKRIVANACLDVQLQEEGWSYATSINGVRYSGQSRNGGYAHRTLNSYYPGLRSGIHPNYNVPIFTSTYNGYGNPFGPSGYTLSYPGYRYYFWFFAPWF